jgi:hypothetical protein
MIEVYKIKIIRKDKNTQYRKKVYESKAKFLKYGKEMFERHHNVKFYNLETYCKIFQMNNESKWVELDIPKEFIGNKR